LGNRNCGRLGKFYEEQVTELQRLLERFVKESHSNHSVEKYLTICEQLGQEPDPAKMPLTYSDFPEEVQVAFFVFSLLSDYWEGNSGTYMGKHWEGLDYLFELYEVENTKVVLFFMKTYEQLLVSYRAEEAERKRKADERKAKASGGRNYTHNVQG